MSRFERDRVAYVVMCAFAYAHQNGISPAASISHLLSCGGIDFLEKNYEIEHTLPLEDTLDALDEICSRQAASEPV